MIKQRRASRQKAGPTGAKRPSSPDRPNPTLNGAVYQATPRDGDRIDQLKIVDLPVGVVAQFYADISGNEVMVSSDVSNRKRRLELSDVSLDETTAAFEDSLKRLEIRIVPVSESIVALIDETP